MRRLFRKDLARNRGNTKGMFIVVCFRLASNLYIAAKRNIIIMSLACIPLLLYKFTFDYIMSIYIPLGTQIGGGLVVFHGFGIVINENAVIGENVTIRHNVTIGGKAKNGRDCPKIGNNVDVGAGAILLGDIEIGEGASIGAGAVVLQSVPANMVAVGNPARIIPRADAG